MTRHLSPAAVRLVRGLRLAHGIGQPVRLRMTEIATAAVASDTTARLALREAVAAGAIVLIRRERRGKRLFQLYVAAGAEELAG